jgi:ribosomal protein S12 methylthiotransferase accessory factor
MKLTSCPKAYTRDQDKAVSPVETVRRVKAILAERCEGVLAETDRVDTGRLGIPVFVSKCGPRAAHVMPTRKQMGKGASPEQAEASALMELVERYSYFSFWDEPANFEELTWSEARERWPGEVLAIDEVLRSVGERMDPRRAEEIMDLVSWRFHPALEVATGRMVRVPLDWFRLLNEFNGSSAGNTLEESVLQGACELVERHVSALIDRAEPELPTIDPASSGDPVLEDLVRKFTQCGVRLVLKDMTLGMPVPTVGALAWDPSTFPGMSEIVFTAGTSSSPVKAAIRAVTEVAQLAGDFHTGRVYEASGLSKYTDLSRIDWLLGGPVVPMDSLPSVEAGDILDELLALAEGLGGLGFALFSVDTSHPDIQVPANYNFVPGFDFRERTPNRGLGLFVGRMLAEGAPAEQAGLGLGVLEEAYPGAHFLPFFRGLVALREDDPEAALELFAASEPLQPGDEERALAAFYQAHALSLLERHEQSVAHLDRAIGLDPEIQQAFNLRGVAHFLAGRYEEAARDFRSALDLDTGQPQILANLGACHQELGEEEQAKDYLESALAMDPGLDGARRRLERLGGE